MKLSELAPPLGATHKKRRCGLGRSSGHGKTSGRGQKGQRSRSGHGIRPWLEGGQMAMVYRIPKRGFTHVKHVRTEVVNLRSLARFAAGSVVDPAALASHGLIRGADCTVKILGDGTVTHPLVVKAHGFSQTAAARIVEAGGQAQTIPPPAAPPASPASPAGGQA
ncbi:MAG: 50S ribosomal protein L15 [Omnitrophica WOR_2 bacterium RIFCSPHIGHO2_02_FULL_68_15]|nr:MAG: 50S ribosomal protein L15 [Omnitrophica WOR_2 bacterium RIFCSPHIGHO2_02_FULL_68_15]